VLEKENSFGKGLAHSEGTFAARIDGWITWHNIFSEKMCSESDRNLLVIIYVKASAALFPRKQLLPIIVYIR
jgi:hypothetical protein